MGRKTIRGNGKPREKQGKGQCQHGNNRLKAERKSKKVRKRDNGDITHTGHSRRCTEREKGWGGGDFKSDGARVAEELSYLTKCQERKGGLEKVQAKV